MKFIGRQQELNTLEAEYRKDGGFVVIYGRRRVGKTTLIKEFIKKKTSFYFLAMEEVESQSMRRLAGSSPEPLIAPCSSGYFRGLAGSVSGGCPISTWRKRF